MNRISLKNMTEEEKKAHKREIHRLHQRKYYEKNKDYYRNYQRNWARELIKDRDREIERLNNIINELENYHIKSMENLENTEDFKYIGVNHIKILYEEHKRTLDKLKELKEGK